ncbi:MAG: hypothetical protein BGP01_05505 [Paludibacter sp. 47-17]|nr:MAG: hypothetical protein BGO84_03030 [Dysgonomonas sp. 37-18]OJX90818.1 MAG: hypothetical protein BGP01_05505 [Paludibacter sp. 47-17]
MVNTVVGILQFQSFHVLNFQILLLCIALADVVNGTDGHVNGQAAEDDAKRQNGYQPPFRRHSAAYTAKPVFYPIPKSVYLFLYHTL